MPKHVSGFSLTPKCASTLHQGMEGLCMCDGALSSTTATSVASMLRHRSCCGDDACKTDVFASAVHYLVPIMATPTSGTDSLVGSTLPRLCAA
jgi:hypothetical protein